MLRRLQQRRDFDRLLAVPPCQRSAHFAVHYLKTEPLPSRRSLRHRAAAMLSTDSSTESDDSVDNSLRETWLGQMLPKRHAALAVTRNLLRRQVRAAVVRHEARLAPGLWLVRLRRPFARADFPSAASQTLRRVAASELDQLFARIGR
ncbi:MAG: ribonuclease P protein component [Burkholderiaceae bacterium]|jgi:ribonuclease P protein component|nr:ribonuclease P protein component [Burkholderiaceae bacterium]